MPREDRRIVFNYTEVYKAIFAFCIQKEMDTPPAGEIIGLTKDEKTECILIKLENQLDVTKHDLEYSQDFLAAALMLFCRGCGIPLPKGGKKSILVKGKEAMLRIQM